MERNQKIPLDANPAVACIWRDRPPGQNHPRGRHPRSRIRTDLDAFSEVEQAVLVNHGYALIDAAIRTRAPALISMDAVFVLPLPAFAPPAMVEAQLRERLKGSEKRKTTGRS